LKYTTGSEGRGREGRGGKGRGGEGKGGRGEDRRGGEGRGRGVQPVFLLVFTILATGLCDIDVLFSEKLIPVYFIYFTSEFIDIIFGEYSSDRPMIPPKLQPAGAS